MDGILFIVEQLKLKISPKIDRKLLSILCDLVTKLIYNYSDEKLGKNENETEQMNTDIKDQ